MWGGATFDVAYRFLKDPWEGRELRKRIPNNVQMLLRGANAVGYTNYRIILYVNLYSSPHSGIDVFRIFGSLNWLRGMEVAIDEVLQRVKSPKGCVCYTGDILDETRTKYDLKYYVQTAKEIERWEHILGIRTCRAA